MGKLKDVKKMKARKGITLVELLIALALVSIVIVAGTNFLLFGIKGHTITIDEFNIQSNTRLVSSKINSIIRDASGVFVLHRDDDENLTDEWNYIMLNDDKTKLLEYVWDGTSKSHTVNELVTGLNEVNFDLEFIKNNPSDEDKLLEFYLKVMHGGKEKVVNTEIEAKNALQVVDRSYLNKGNTLSYRYDSRLGDASNAQAVVAMVLDRSGSMAANMNADTNWWGDYTNVNDNHSNPYYHSRLKKMKAEAVRLVEELAKKPNINISIIPFNSTANDPGDMLATNTNLNAIKQKINELTATGGTNTGDAIRRGFYQISEFNEDEANKNKTNKNFMIVLVDGVTTFASTHEIIREEISFSSNQGSYVTQNGKRYDYNRRSGFIFYTYYYRYEEIEYVDGNNNIQNSQMTSVNSRSDIGKYAGDGGSLDPWGTEYVNFIGEKVKVYKEGTNEAIQVYVIGFSAVTADHGSLGDIAMATRGDTVYYEAGDSEALEDIFKAIQRDITDALWHIGGPN